MEKQYDIYEYITVRIKYSLAEDCRKCYESFGWETLQERISNEGKKLQFRRRRNISERARLMEQQRVMENAMARVEHYEQQRELLPVMICIFFVRPDDSGVELMRDPSLIQMVQLILYAAFAAAPAQRPAPAGCRLRPVNTTCARPLTSEGIFCCCFSQEALV